MKGECWDSCKFEWCFLVFREFRICFRIESCFWGRMLGLKLILNRLRVDMFEFFGFFLVRFRVLSFSSFSSLVNRVCWFFVICFSFLFVLLDIFYDVFDEICIFVLGLGFCVIDWLVGVLFWVLFWLFDFIDFSVILFLGFVWILEVVVLVIDIFFVCIFCFIDWFFELGFCVGWYWFIFNDILFDMVFDFCGCLLFLIMINFILLVFIFMLFVEVLGVLVWGLLGGWIIGDKLFVEVLLWLVFLIFLFLFLFLLVGELFGFVICFKGNVFIGFLFFLFEYFKFDLL